MPTSYYVYPGYWVPGYAEGDPDPSSRDYEPYAPNAKALTEVLIDLKNTFGGTSPTGVTGFRCTAFETITQGQAVYIRASDGKVGRAIANDTEDKATVSGFAKTSKSTGEALDVIVAGVVATTGLISGQTYYLSSSTPGAITVTPPSGAGNYVTRLGRGSGTHRFSIQLEPPILLA